MLDVSTRLNSARGAKKPHAVHVTSHICCVSTRYDDVLGCIPTHLFQVVVHENVHKKPLFPP